MGSFYVSRANYEESKNKGLLEIGLLKAGYPLTQPEQAFIAAILAAPRDPNLRLIFADWLEEQGRAEEALLVRVVARGKCLRSASAERSWTSGPNYGQIVQLFAPGKWSVVRRITEGANGGHRQHIVSWKRMTIDVVRVTTSFAILADGKRFALDTLSACVPLKRISESPFERALRALPPSVAYDPLAMTDINLGSPLELPL